jgi:hypothetical protein
MVEVDSCLLSPQRTRFDPRPVCGNLLWTVLHLDGILRVLRFSSFIIISPWLHIYLHVHVSLTRRTNVRSLEEGCHLVLSNVQRDYVYSADGMRCSSGGRILTEQNRSTRRKTFENANLSVRNPTRTSPVSNPVHRSEDLNSPKYYLR